VVAVDRRELSDLWRGLMDGGRRPLRTLDRMDAGADSALQRGLPAASDSHVLILTVTDIESC
jgi:hypothetical protein